MKKTFQYPNTLLNLADESLKIGNKNKALAICDSFFRIFSDKKICIFSLILWIWEILLFQIIIIS